MAELEITFLGTGTSQGVPMIGCDCPVCRSDDPRDKRTRSSIYLRHGDHTILVDAGPDLRTQCLREGIGRCDAAIFTHSHTDHIMGFDDMRRFCDAQPTRTLPIYASAATMADLRRVFGFAFEGDCRFPGYLNPIPHVVEGPFALAGLEITPLPVPHGRASVNGYLFRRDGRPLLAYLSDCKAVPELLRELIAGVEVLVVDALRLKPHPTHMSLDEALAVAAAVRPGRTLLTHLCHDLGHAGTECGLPTGVHVAYDGLRLQL